MRILFLLSVFFGLFCGAVLAAGESPLAAAAKKLKVKKGHPILFVDADLVGRIRAKKDDCRRFGERVKKYRERKTNDPNDTEAIRKEVARFSNWTHPGTYLTTSMWYGLDAYINKNPLSVAYGRQYLIAVLDQDIATAKKPECHVLGSVFAVGALYDWLYPHLDEDLKHQARLGVLRIAGALDTKWRFFRDRGYIGGHPTCWANPYALVGLLAIRQDIEREAPDVQARYFELLGKVARNIRDGIAPAHAWICKDGGHHMGWDYGTCYTTMLPYMVWDFATDEPSLFTGWQNQHAYWYIYGPRNQAAVTARGDRNIQRKMYGQYPNFGDCYGTSYNDPKKFNILTAAFKYDNPHAKWLFNHFNAQSEGYIAYEDLLYKHFGPKEGEPPDKLPIARCFRNAGFTVMRDRWDFDRNTLVVFKSTPFYSMNHHHKDQNSFTVYYRCPLAIDSGGYALCGKYGSRHWYNYYTRSVAHNTVLVYDPAEDFGKCRWGKLSNDGGQAFGKSPGRVEDIQPGGKCALDGIQRFENRPEYAYTMGDATKAYSPHKMALFQRHVVYLRHHSYDHPVIVVYDRVTSKKAEFKKTYLLHSIGKPVVKGRTFFVEGDDGLDPAHRGRLYDEVILPEQADIRLVGGLGKQEFYVADDGTGKPHNYREEFARDYPKDAAIPAIQREHGQLRELGEWRAEVSPSEKRLDDRFLNVLSVTDGDDKFLPVRTRRVGSASFDGAAIYDNDGQDSTLVLFRRGDGPIEGEIDGGGDCRAVLLIGLEPGRNYAVARAGDNVRIEAAAEGIRASAQGTLYVVLDS
ncbi:MAG: hypothetical protein GXP25_00830 [Planctomycetes bacterium]|nr:hypothetical protein [Planctomycetota bacterium]